MSSHLSEWVESTKQPGFEFIYLGYRKDSKLGTKCLYDVEVVPSSKVDFSEDITMSPEGVTLYHNNTMGTKFMIIIHM